jgi:hypothetical protein
MALRAGGQIRGEDVVGVAVEALARAVVGPGVSIAGCYLDVAELDDVEHG